MCFLSFSDGDFCPDKLKGKFVVATGLTLNWLQSSRPSSLPFSFLPTVILFKKNSLLKMNTRLIVKRFLPVCLLLEKILRYRESRHRCAEVRLLIFHQYRKESIPTCSLYSVIVIRMQWYRLRFAVVLDTIATEFESSSCCSKHISSMSIECAKKTLIIFACLLDKPSE